MSWTFRAGTRQLEFGGENRGLGLVEFPQVNVEMTTVVRDNPRGDGRRFGHDLIPGQTVTMLVDVRSTERSLDEVWRELASVWRADEVRKRGGELATLTADSGRHAYGRPRPFSQDHSTRLFDLSRAELVFECIDDLWYGPGEVTTIRFTPVFTGGLPVPAAVPFVLGGGTGVSAYAVTVGGDVATAPVFELHGPILDPFIEVVGVGRLIFRGQLAYDQTLTVDTRPWTQWVKRDGAAFPGALSPDGSRLSDMVLRPGSYQVFFGGYDPTGTSSLDVIVEPAFTSF